uniref:Uncharacterized protein n=1 Tax=Arundo donax TaxID=35708 RepID=A0A0A8XSP0_ARUDO
MFLAVQSYTTFSFLLKTHLLHIREVSFADLQALQVLDN